MNIFGYFPLFQSFTFCKSTSDIKKIQNKMAATQVALLLLSSILLTYTVFKRPPKFAIEYQSTRKLQKMSQN